MAVSSPSADSYTPIFHQFVLRAIDTVSCYLQKGEVLPAEERAQAWQVLRYGLKLPAAWPAARRMLLELAPQMERDGFRHEWLPLLESGVESSRREEDQATEAQLSFYIGRVYRLRGALLQAQQWFQTSIDRYADADDPHGLATALNQLAYVAYLQGRFDDAKTTADHALSLLAPDDSERAVSFFVLGRVAQEHRDMASAEHYQRAALQAWHEAGNPQRTAWAFFNLGDTLRVAGRYDEATIYLEQAIILLGQLHDHAYQAVARMNLGIVASLQGKSDEAMALYQLAEDVFRRVSDALHLAMVYNNMAYEARIMRQWQLAEQHCRASIALWERLGVNHSLASPYIELGLTYLGQERYAEATETFEQGLALLPPALVDGASVEMRQMLCKHLADARDKGRSSQQAPPSS